MERDNNAVLNDFKYEGSRHEGPRHEGPRHEGPRHEGPRHEGPRHEGSRHEGPRHEGPRHEGPRHEGPRHEGPRHEGPRHEDLKQDGNLEHHVDELLIRISGNKMALNEIKQVVIEFKNNSLEKPLHKPDKEEKGKVLCERKK